MRDNGRRSLSCASAAAGRIFCLLLALVPTVAGAHAQLSASVPADSAVLERPPETLILRFNEPVEAVSLRLIGSSGFLKTLDTPKTVDRELNIDLPPNVTAGSYAVAWRVLSADAHPVGGTIGFSVGTGSLSARSIQIPTDGDTTWQWIAMSNRALADAATLFTIGGVLFSALVLRRDARRSSFLKPALVASSGIGVLANAFAIAITGAWIGNASITDIFNLSSWQAGWNTSMGSRAISSIAGLGLIVAGTFSARRWLSSGLFAAGVLVTSCSFILAGHVAGLAPPWPQQVGLLLHVLTAAFWLGSLWPLYRLLPQLSNAEALVILRRFSSVAMGAVITLVIAGIYLAFTFIQSVEALTGTRYGQTLLLKIVSVAALLSIAAYNRRWLMRKFSAKAKARLLTNIRIEIVLSGVVLILTAALSHTSPELPARVDGKHVYTQTNARGYRMALRIDPARAGSNEVSVALRHPDGAPLASKEIVIEFSLPSIGIEGLQRALEPNRSPGTYELKRIDLPTTGRWQVGIEALVNDFEKIRLETVIEIQ